MTVSSLRNDRVFVQLTADHNMLVFCSDLPGMQIGPRYV
jgi:hypothetical protein